MLPWVDVRITIPFVVVPGQADVVILGDMRLKENVDIDVIKQLKQHWKCGETTAVWALRWSAARTSQLVNERRLEVNMETLQRTAGGR